MRSPSGLGLPRQQRGRVMISVLQGLVLALTVAIAGEAAAQAAPTPQASVQMSEVERGDLAIRNAAAADFNRLGFAGLTRHVPDMKSAWNRMPENYPLIDRQGDSYIVRTHELADILLLSGALKAADEGAERAISVIQSANVYGDIAQFLGSEAIERHRYQEALVFLDRALATQPANWVLLNEKASALQGLRRWSEALDIIDRAMATNDVMLMLHKPPLLRRRGFSLIELGRLDEAREAYEESLRIDPDNEIAKSELAYIARLKAGAPAEDAVVIAPDAPQSGSEADNDTASAD